MEDYYVKWGIEDSVKRSDYMNEKDARKLFSKKKVEYKKCHWVELWHEPLGEDESILIESKEISKRELDANRIIENLF
ncbi:hypothetical protein [Methanobrevibacter sp.]|uniref:hypothetical protein n=1 Tax=Methanobrevibacter sp. TaxID=66852 RepID=UPI00388F8B4F